MASRRLGITATTNDALANEDIRLVEVLSQINFWASSVTNGDQVGLRLNKTIIMDDGEVNTIAGDVIAVETDQLVFNTVVGPGQIKVPVPTLTTELQFLISVEPVL
jgi:hypothetical protein